FYCLKLNRQLEGIKINNDAAFTDFVSYVYFVYRKIEKKMIKNGYENILQELESDKNTIADISTQLIEAKKIFNSTDKSDFLKVHSVFKKLFFCYINYMKNPMNNERGINENDFLSGR